MKGHIKYLFLRFVICVLYQNRSFLAEQFQADYCLVINS